MTERCAGSWCSAESSAIARLRNRSPGSGSAWAPVMWIWQLSAAGASGRGIRRFRSASAGPQRNLATRCSWPAGSSNRRCCASAWICFVSAARCRQDAGSWWRCTRSRSLTFLRTHRRGRVSGVARRPKSFCGGRRPQAHPPTQHWRDVPGAGPARGARPSSSGLDRPRRYRGRGLRVGGGDRHLPGSGAYRRIARRAGGGDRHRIGDRFDPSIPVLAADVPAMQAFLGRGQPANIDAAMRTLDGALAELAERLPRSAALPPPAVDHEGIDSALTVLQRRLADERTALQAELWQIQSELDHLRESPEHRITRPIREGYQRWQRRQT